MRTLFVEVCARNKENVPRYAAVKKALTDAGYKVESAGGYGYYGCSAVMLTSKATIPELKKVLSAKKFFKELVFVSRPF